MANRKIDKDIAKECPWCGRWSLKASGCNHVVCGRADGGFIIDSGCGKQWCFLCGLKLCTRLYNPETGKKIEGASENHRPGKHKPTLEDPCSGEGYCPGGHNSHK